MWPVIGGRVQGHVINSLNNLRKQGNLTLDELALHVNPPEMCYKKSSFTWTLLRILQTWGGDYLTLNIVKHLLTWEMCFLYCVIFPICSSSGSGSKKYSQLMWLPTNRDLMRNGLRTSMTHAVRCAWPALAALTQHTQHWHAVLAFP